MTTSSSSKILMAGILGFVVGILYAPRKGSQTQEKLGEQWGEMKSGLSAKVDSAKDKLHELKGSKRDTLDAIDKSTDEVIDKAAS